MYQDCDANISEIGSRLHQNMMEISGSQNDSTSIQVQDNEYVHHNYNS